MNYAEVTVRFPYLNEPNQNGLIFTKETKDVLRSRINLTPDNPVQVTLYQSKGEYEYATHTSSIRYAEVDPQFKIGTVSKIDINTGDLTLLIKEDAVNAVENGKILPRAIVKRVRPSVGAGKQQAMILERLICLDILSQDAGN